MPLNPPDSAGFLLWHATLRWQRNISAALAQLTRQVAARGGLLDPRLVAEYATKERRIAAEIAEGQHGDGWAAPRQREAARRRGADRHHLALALLHKPRPPVMLPGILMRNTRPDQVI